MTVATKSSKQVLKAKKILEGDGVSLLPESGGFCTCGATGDGVLLSTYGSRDIFLSEENLYKLVNHVLKGEAHTTLEFDEFKVAVEVPTSEESK